MITFCWLRCDQSSNQIFTITEWLEQGLIITATSREPDILDLSFNFSDHHDQPSDSYGQAICTQ
jgi:hypothetical protein